MGRGTCLGHLLALRKSSAFIERGGLGNAWWPMAWHGIS